jgi:hypothetical protein
MQPERLVRAKLDLTGWEPRKVEPAKVQKRLFPE